MSGILQHAKHIELSNVPLTAMPSDIRRAIARVGLQGVSDVAIDYHRFSPIGRALISLTDPALLRNDLRLLEKFTIAGTPVYATPRFIEERHHRTRGEKGRAEAAERGIGSGDGPHAGLLQNLEKTTVVWGFPGKMSPKMVDSILKDFRVVRTKQDLPRIVKVPLPDDAFSMVSRFVITLDSVSEAYRLVRQFHMTHYDHDIFGTKYTLRAQVIC